MAQTGQFGQLFGQTNGGLVGEPSQHHVLQAIHLPADRGLDAWFVMAEQVDPPAGNRIEKTPAFAVV